jgi:hypothetical protein
MLPDPSFAQAIQRVPEQGKERAVMGQYFPRSRYYADKGAFEKLGCKQLRDSNPVAKKRCRDTTPPRSSIRHSAPEAAARGRFTGRSIDFGCRGGPRKRSRAGRLEAVFVVLSKDHTLYDCGLDGPGEKGGEPCTNGRIYRAELGKPRADGKVPWRLHVRHLEPGHYRARVYGRDAAGNRETKVRRTNRAAFTVR